MTARRHARRRGAASRLLSSAGMATCLLAVVACTPPGLPPPIAPMSPGSAPPATGESDQIVVGVDGVVGGFNPYAIADFSPAAQAVASLVLPSASLHSADGSMEPDPAVVEGAEVTSRQPFTVTYTLNRNAAWSDGTPVTAEDFTYLAEQMLVQPGTVDPAGYRLIAGIRSRDAGKLVEVEFSSPFPQWPTLFSPLLPSHILKDAPGGWSDGLDGGIPVAAGRYKLSSFDRVTGEITLVRNDKYWGEQPGPATVVLRIGTPSELVAALDRGDIQALFGQPDGTTEPTLIGTVPPERRVAVPLPATTQLVFDTTAGPTADPLVRKAIVAGLDLGVLRSTLGAARSDGLLSVSSLVRLPAQQAEAGEPPVATREPDTADDALRAAGFDVSGLYATKDGKALRLTLAYPARDQRLAAAARSIQRQLGRVGIEVNLLADDADRLITERLSGGTHHLALVTVPRGIADAPAASSAFGCSPPEEPRTSNLSGFCDPSLSAAFENAIDGSGSLDGADSMLWAALPIVPLGQPVAVFAVGPDLAPVVARSDPSWLWTGPLRGIPDWPAR